MHVVMKPWPEMLALSLLAASIRNRAHTSRGYRYVSLFEKIAGNIIALLTLANA